MDQEQYQSKVKYHFGSSIILKFKHTQTQPAFLCVPFIHNQSGSAIYDHQNVQLDNHKQFVTTD